MIQTMPLLAMLTPPQIIEYGSLLPASILCVAAFVTIIIDLYHAEDTSRGYLSYVSALAFGLSALSCYFLWDHTLDAPTFHGMLYLDKFALFFGGLVSVGGAISALLSPAYLRSIRMERSEFYMLTLFSAAGMIIIAAAADLLSIFLALEVMSIPLYCIAAFSRTDRRSAEAGLKYFVLGAFSTALTLYGVALLYGMTGTTNLEGIAAVVGQMVPAIDQGAFEASHGITVLGVFLVLSGFLFKVGAAPFHLWTPDVYTGAPTPATGFMATGVKAASFAVLLRLVIVGFHDPNLVGGFFGIGWLDAFFLFGAASIIIGNLAALAQSNVKRMLAYSSIAHAGYMLVGFVAANAKPEYYLFNDTVLFYLAAYTFTTLGAFGVLAVLSRASGKPVETYDDLVGVGLKFPIIGLLMAIFMFSSAGIPPAAGFLAKFYIFRAAVEVGAHSGSFAFIGVTILAVLASICGIYYYLKVLVVMYMSSEESQVQVTGSTGAIVGLIVCGVLVLWNGIFPQQLIDLSQRSILDMEGTSHLEAQIEKGNRALVARKIKTQQRIDDQLRKDLEKDLRVGQAVDQLADRPNVAAPAPTEPTPAEPTPAAAPTVADQAPLQDDAPPAPLKLRRVNLPNGGEPLEIRGDSNVIRIDPDVMKRLQQGLNKE